MYATSPTAPITAPKKEEPKAEEKKTDKGTGMVNYCRTGDGMSVCTIAGKKWVKQIDCKFSIKSDRSERCMHETFEEYCWSTEAQKAANALKGTRYNLTS